MPRCTWRLRPMKHSTSRPCPRSLRRRAQCSILPSLPCPAHPCGSSATLSTSLHLYPSSSAAIASPWSAPTRTPHSASTKAQATFDTQLHTFRTRPRHQYVPDSVHVVAQRRGKRGERDGRRSGRVWVRGQKEEEKNHAKKGIEGMLPSSWCRKHDEQRCTDNRVSMGRLVKHLPP